MKSKNTTNSEWVEYIDPEHNYPYYYNHITGESRWDRPEDMHVNELETTKESDAEEDFNSSIEPAQRKQMPAHMLVPRIEYVVALAHDPELMSPNPTYADDYSDMDEGSDISDGEYRRYLSSLSLEQLRLFEDRLPVSILRRKEVETVPGGTNQDYLALAREYLQQRPYMDPHSSLSCVLCHENEPWDVFFPCEHRCVCRSCIEKENVVEESRMMMCDASVSSHCNCPLCGAIVRRILPSEGGAEIEKYWRWVLEVNPPLPTGFLGNFKHSAAVIKKVFGLKDSRREKRGRRKNRSDEEDVGENQCSVA